MRIGVNCLQVDPGYVGGVNTYVFGLLDGFAAKPGAHTFQIYVSPRNAALFERFLKVPHFHVFRVDEADSVFRRSIRRLALKSGIPAVYAGVVNALFPRTRTIIRSNSDLLYTPTTVLFPFEVGVPQVLSMHDIQHEHFPEFFTPAELKWRRLMFYLSAKHAAYLQASSQFIQRDLIEHFPSLRAEQIEVIREGVEVERFAEPSPATGNLRSKYGLPEQFVFYPAQLWKHKNHITVLRALKLIELTAGVRIPLILTGAKMSASDEIFSFIREEKMEYVNHLGKIPFVELVALYQTATITITAALYESSSLCLLEAAAAGSALLASATPPNQEMATVLQATLFSPLDANELADKLLCLWRDPDRRHQQRDHNAKAVRSYAWTEIADCYNRWFDRLTPELAALRQS